MTLEASGTRRAVPKTIGSPTCVRSWNYARDSGAESIVLVGASLGASLSIAMAGELDATALVSLSAPALVFNANDAAASAGTIPVMIAAAEGNEPYASDARSLAATLGIDPVIATGDGHGTGMFGDNPELITQIVTFLDQGARRRLSIGLSARTSGTTGRC